MDNSNIRYCRFCGKQIDADAEFCTHCGKGTNVMPSKYNWVKSVVDWSKNVSKGVKSLFKRMISYKIPQEKKDNIKRFMSKILKILLRVIIIGSIIAAIVATCIYYFDTYLPKKRFDKVVDEIIFNLTSSNDSIRTEYSFYVLYKEHKWNNEEFSDNYINSRLIDYYETSFKQIEKKAYEGNPRWQFTLGQLYCWGDEYYNYIKQDYEKAAFWWNEAASQGYVRAYNNLGMAYKEGKGVQKDLRKAVELLKKGAEAGENWAQKHYGDLFVDGVKIKIGSHKERRTSDHYVSNYIKHYYDNKSGDFLYLYEVTIDEYETLVPKDIEQAKYWWKKSADQGNEVAKERLQKIYN